MVPTNPAETESKTGYRASLRPEFFSNCNGGIADLIDDLLKLVFRHAELMRPVFDLGSFVHVDFGAVAMVALREMAHGVPFHEANLWAIPSFLKSKAEGRAS